MYLQGRQTGCMFKMRPVECSDMFDMSMRKREGSVMAQWITDETTAKCILTMKAST